MNKTGQLTIFFIVGLVLVIVFGMLAYIVFDTVETQEGVTAQARNYLSSCVENTVHSYFDSLATADYYAILGPSMTSPEDLGIEQSLNELYGPIISRYDDTTRSTLFGTRNLTPLCDPEGPNSRTQTQNIRCFIDSYGPDSHQEQLKEKIKENLIACSNERNDEELGTRISEWPDPEVTVTFGKSSVLVLARYEEDNQELYTLDLSYDSRLLQLYSLIEERLVMTTKDPRITVTNQEHTEQSTFYRQGFILSMQEEGDDWKYTFTDTNSNYRGSQLTISFLGEDRPPYEDSNVEIGEDEQYPKYDPDTGFVPPSQTSTLQIPAYCDSTRQMPTSWNRLTQCENKNGWSDSDCRYFKAIKPWSSPFVEQSGIGANLGIKQPQDYIAIAFSTHGLKPTATGSMQINRPQTEANLRSERKLMSISTCPGDFNKEKIIEETGCLIESFTQNLLWGASGTGNDCVLQPDKTYYLNILFTESPIGTPTNEIEPHQDCDEVPYCGNAFYPSISN